MADRDLDHALVARALRWCAEAGRPSGEAEVRAALAPLLWDELLAVRALLADPPPAAPLGPQALAEIARGLAPGAAAERERAGDFGHAGEASEPPASDDGAPDGADAEGAPARPRRRRRATHAAGPVIHRARDRVAPEIAAPPRLPLVDVLYEEEGRAVLERLVRQHGARRAPVLAALQAGWARGDGSPPGDDELDGLLDAHGLARGFAHRERDELLHALRAAGGLRRAAAETLGLDAAGFEAALDRLRARGDADAIRAAHRTELGRRGTLAERARLLATERERLADLGLDREIADDLRARLPGHLRALRASAGALLPALAQSLALEVGPAVTLLRELGIDPDAFTAGAAGSTRPERPAGGSARPGGSARNHGARPAAGKGRPSARPGASRSGSGRPGRQGEAPRERVRPASRGPRRPRGPGRKG